MSGYPIGQWRQISSRQRFHLHRFLEPEYLLNFDDSIGAVAPGGGALAITADPRKWARTGVLSADLVSIFNQGGATLGTIRLGRQTLVNLGWSNTEILALVTADGRVSVHSVRGAPLHMLEPFGGATIVTHCCFFGNAVALLTASQSIAIYDDFTIPTTTPVIYHLSDHLITDESIHCLAGGYQTSDTASRTLFIGTSTGRIAMINGPNVQFTTLASTPIVRLACAPGVRRVAAWAVVAGPLGDASEDEALVVDEAVVEGDGELSSDVLALNLDSDGDDSCLSDSPARPSASSAHARGRLIIFDSSLRAGRGGEYLSYPAPQLGWVSPDTVALVTPNDDGVGRAVICIDAESRSAAKVGVVSSRPCICQESDGLRILHAEGADLLRQIPPAVLATFAPAAAAPEPATLIIEACAQGFGDGRAHDVVCNVISPEQLPTACLHLIEAARVEPSPTWQRRLLAAVAVARAAAAGRDPALTAALTQLAGEAAATVEALRLCNALASDIQLAMPVTPAQLRALGPELLLARVSARGAHGVALSAARWLGLTEAENNALVSWAVEKAQDVSIPDEIVTDSITQQLGLQGAGVSHRFSLQPIFDAVAADPELRPRRQRLIQTLVSCETDPEARADLLMRCDRQREALHDAVSVCDSMLVLHIIFSMQSKTTDTATVVDTAAREHALGALAHYAAAADPELLRTIANSQHANGPAAAAAGLASGDALALTDGLLALAAGGADDALACLDSAAVVAPASVAEQIRPAAKLLDAQHALEEVLGCTGFVGLPGVATVEAMYTAGRDKAAHSLATDLGISPLREQLAKARALASLGNFIEMRKMSTGRKPRAVPPAHALAAICLECDSLNDAAYFADHIPEHETRAIYLLRAQRYRDGVDAALATQDPSSYQRVIDAVAADAHAVGMLKSEAHLLTPK